MRKKRSCIGFSLLFLLALLLCSHTQIWAKLPVEIQEIIALNRAEFDQEFDVAEQIAKFEEYLYRFETLDGEPDLLSYADERSALARLTKDQALADLDFFFSLVKYGYAPYEYFGGDKKFLAAKELIKAELEGGPSSISSMGYVDLLGRNLNFINDGHFSIGHKVLFTPTVMYMNFEYAFFKDDKGFYLHDGDIRSHISEINGGEPRLFMRASLDEAGELVYRLGVFDTTGQGELEATLTLVSGDSVQKLLLLPLGEIVSTRIIGDDIYQRYELDDVLVVANRGFPFWGPNAEEFNVDDALLMEDFFLDAYKLRDEKTFILDTRSHRGGESQQGYSWINNFTGGYFPGPAFLGANLQTKTAKTMTKIHEERVKRSSSLFVRPIKATEGGWSSILYALPERIENESTIVVLTDSWAASGGDLFANALRHVDNVIFIGTNTAGIYLTSRLQTQLPNSHINVCFGPNIRMPFDLTVGEGIGFLPDFWVHPDEALNVAVKFIKNYVR